MIHSNITFNKINKFESFVYDHSYIKEVDFIKGLLKKYFPDKPLWMYPAVVERGYEKNSFHFMDTYDINFMNTSNINEFLSSDDYEYLMGDNIITLSFYIDYYVSKKDESSLKVVDFYNKDGEVFNVCDEDDIKHIYNEVNFIKELKSNGYNLVRKNESYLIYKL